jgi:hypothetical protein
MFESLALVSGRDRAFAVSDVAGDAVYRFRISACTHREGECSRYSQVVVSTAIAKTPDDH